VGCRDGKILAALGFEALATTSLGLAIRSAHRRHGRRHARGGAGECRIIAAATDLPVNADLENLYADEPREAAEMIRLASDSGIVGGSIEDATGDAAKPIYDLPSRSSASPPRRKWRTRCRCRSC